MSVEVKSDGRSFSPGTPRPFGSVNVEPAERRNRYVATKDGQRFLVVSMTDAAEERMIVVELGSFNRWGAP
ncbi:MAG: hypothetical protein ABI882_06370 [Acidobacteriota bacterium]